MELHACYQVVVSEGRFVVCFALVDFRGFRMIQVRRFRISNRRGAVRSFSWRKSVKYIKKIRLFVKNRALEQPPNLDG